MFEVSEVDVNTHTTNHVQFIDDHTLTATKIECTFSVESRKGKGHVGDRNFARDDQSKCLEDNDDKQSIDAKKRKHTKKIDGSHY